MASEKTKILIIEDEVSLVELLSNKLKKEGYDVEKSFDGEEGLEKVYKFKPDLILLDIMMPKKNGYEVLEELKSKDIKTPVVIISNSGQPVEIEKTKQLGAVGHLIKTEFSPENVLEKVKSCLNGDNIISEEHKEQVLIPRENPDAKKLGIKVLLVEDDSFLREISSKKLTKEGFTVFEAVDGEQALIGAKKANPDIVLLDIILPAVDGFQILSEIRSFEDKKAASVPIVMLSNLGQDDDIKRAMEGGANDYMVKAHFTTEEIVEKIKELLKKK